MKVGLLGGSFNPPHIGHLRLAIETGEALGLDHVELIPCSIPPHKEAAGLLPFAMRVKMLEQAIGAKAGLRVNPIEGQRQGPSYTFDTLLRLKADQPENEFFFIIGREDFFMLPDWHNGLALPSLCNFAIIPRGDPDPKIFFETAKSFWKDIIIKNEGKFRSAITSWGTSLIFMPLPRLDISASFLRERWLSGRDTSFLIPEGTAGILDEHRSEIENIWRSKQPC